MLHYVDIHLRPDPEFPAHLLMAALYTKLHRWLARTQSNRVAVSFPEYQKVPPGLGSVMRLIGPAVELARLMEHSWMTGMNDHVAVDHAAAVPDDARQRVLRRVQAKSSPERLRRRRMRRHNVTAEEVRELVPDSCAETLTLPFLTLASNSTGQRFKLFLRLGPPVTSSEIGDFNSYGLSSTATIPWF